MPNLMRRDREVHTGRRGVSLVSDLDKAWADGWRMARRTCDMTPEQAAKIDDLTRKRGCTMLLEGIEIIRATSKDPADAVALTEKLRGYLLSGVALDLSEGEAMLRETEANHHGNLAQMRHSYFRSLGTRDAVAETMSAQAVASRLLADTVLKERPALISLSHERR